MTTETAYPAFMAPEDEFLVWGNRVTTIDPTAFIHKLAVVDDTVTIGANTKIWSGALVRNGTKLGANVSVGIGCALEGCEVGSFTHINPHVLMGVGIIVGERCFIAGSCIIANDVWPSADREANGGWNPPPGWVTVRIGDDTALGSLAVVMPGVTIGSRCMVAAQACVTADLPDDHLWTRDGKIKRIDPSKILRMREAAPP